MADHLKVLKQSDPIEFGFIFPNNYFRYQERFPDLINPRNIKAASGRSFSKKENLVCVEAANRPFILDWVFNKKLYHLVVSKPVLLDGASTPVRIGGIANFGPHIQRAFLIHDLIYALFHDIPRKEADKIFRAFVKIDGGRKISRATMYVCLRFFGGKARTMKPKDHWNYGRAKLTVTDLEE